MIEHSKEYGVYHWDTFDNTTFFDKDFDDLEEAKKHVEKKYNVRPDGADRVDIVDLKGNIVEKFKIG